MELVIAGGESGVSNPSFSPWNYDLYGNDGFTPELVDSFATVGHLDGDESTFTYSQNGNEITEEEYNAKIQSYEVALTTILDWIQIQ